MMKTDWQRGALYTRTEINRGIGGGMQEFLPHVDGKVVCGCFTPDLNPDAPREVLPGNGPKIIHWANQFYEQRTTVPIFLKRGTNQWEYVGNWRANTIVTDTTEIAKQEQRTGRTDISMILMLVEVPPGPDHFPLRNTTMPEIISNTTTTAPATVVATAATEEPKAKKVKDPHAPMAENRLGGKIMQVLRTAKEPLSAQEIAKLAGACSVSQTVNYTMPTWLRLYLAKYSNDTSLVITGEGIKATYSLGPKVAATTVPAPAAPVAPAEAVSKKAEIISNNRLLRCPPSFCRWPALDDADKSHAGGSTHMSIQKTIIQRPAARVIQGSLKLYTTSLRVRDLLMDSFYDIERLDPDDLNDTGYQRVLNKGRAKKLADYLIDGQQDGDSFLPTSIFLATDKSVEFDESTNTLSFDVGTVGPFSVVDGQHRIEGLRMAAEKCPDLLDFEVAVNIAANLSKIAQMCHFLIVNTTQKSVDKSVEQRIFARLTAAVDVDDVPNLPKWIQRIVESGDDEQALKIADYLNETPESPWYKKIEMANESSKTATINQRSFVKAIKRYVLTSNNPISVYPPEKQKKIMLNYWVSVARVLANEKPTVLFKYSGAELFSRFSIPFFNKLANLGDFKTTTMEALLREAFDNLDGEHAGVGHPDWWTSGTGVAGNLNAAALGKITAALTRALHTTRGLSANIQV